jgi:hypothetical protein
MRRLTEIARTADLYRDDPAGHGPFCVLSWFDFCVMILTAPLSRPQ